MATITSPPISTSPKPLRISRLILYFLLLVLVAVLGLIVWLYSVARSALPQLDGKLQLPGLSAPVSVIRDGHGVPTIQAASLDDLFFAQGYVTAQDRLWQMDVMRRAAAGELSEILGDALLKHDREQRILGLRAVARKAAESASEPDRSYFSDYARGVNAYIESRRDHLPVEFRILRYSPRPWTPEDSFVIAVQLVSELNHYHYREALEREKILARLGPELTADLYVNSSWHDRPPTVARPSMEQNRGSVKNDDDDDEDEGGDPAHAVARSREEFPGFAELASARTGRSPVPTRSGPLPASSISFDSDPRLVIGSNDWVVSGAHTVTGKPLLSNDMHLGHQMPNLWYENQLRSGNFDVAGVSLPGMPYVVVGHNARVAWGFTNVGPTVEDVYIETFNANGQYQTPEGWKQPEHRAEVIHVKGKPDVNLDVTLTRHGPVITELIPGETRQLALRWTLYDGLRVPLFEVDSARSWDEFSTAFSKLDAPGQNVVYADVDGNIGYHTTGKVPIRASGDGSLPENGSDNAHEWVSYIPYDKLPSIFNPPWGIIATANGRITPDDYPYSISTGWEAPWRTARIYRVLESGKKFSAADMLALETDIYSEFDRYVADRLVYAVDHAKSSSARARQAAEILRSWDGRMTQDSAAPLLAHRSRRELTRLLLEPKLGPAQIDLEQQAATLNWKTYHWGMASVWMENILLHQPRRWLPEAYANYDELLTAAVEGAVGSPDAPKDLTSWKWGTDNAVEIQHPILGRFPILRRWTGPGLQPQSGSVFTVKAVSRTHGPSERITDDLSDLDQSTMNTVTGQAGNFLSPYYMDQWKAWYEGYTFKFPFTQQAVEKARAHELVLEPK